MNAQLPIFNIIKRDGSVQQASYDKLLARIQKVGDECVPPLQIDYHLLISKILSSLYDQIPTYKIDEFIAEECSTMILIHPDYEIMATHLIINNLHKKTPASFSKAVLKLWESNPAISPLLHYMATQYGDRLDAMVDHALDYNIDYFGFKTLEKSYLMRERSNNLDVDQVVERPQYMFLRVAIGIHCPEVFNIMENSSAKNTNDRPPKDQYRVEINGFKLTGINTFDDDTLFSVIRTTYLGMARKEFIHATPTMFNAATRHPQLSSCFLAAIKEDSVDGIYSTLKDCAKISKYGGGIGLHLHNVRAKGTIIKGTNGTSNGIVPMIRMFNNSVRYIDQGGGKRKGAVAMYIEPWHADIEMFLQMKTNVGSEDNKARDLFYALWTPDLFMQRVQNGEKWSLFCPHQCPGLSDVYGDDFERLYCSYENQNKAVKVVEARDLWTQVLDSQMETSAPYILYKDAANRKSNQKNLGTIKSSNLCTEIIEYSDEKETAVCNLASIGLPTFVTDDKTFDHGALYNTVATVTRNLNKVIDCTYYPIPEAKNSNLRHRPIGIGVQGLADVFAKLSLPFDSNEAKELNRAIFETIYYSAVRTSCYLAKVRGTYETFSGSPMSDGKFQFDLWGVTPSDRWDWKSLRMDVIQHGVRNSLLVAPMPTASTAQILGFNECIEPFTSNMLVRRTLAGEFIVINRYLIRQLIKLNLWSSELKNQIIKNRGSIQNLHQIPVHLRACFKTSWEISMRDIIDMTADRGAYICQSQSTNLWMENPTAAKMQSMYFYGWKKGLKTGVYYLRRKAVHNAQQFTVEPDTLKYSSSTTGSVSNVAKLIEPQQQNEEEECLNCSA